MQVESITERRKVAVARRHQPTGVHTVEFPACDDGIHGPELGAYPDELRLEATHQDGKIVDWFDDNWWLETLRRWKDRTLTIHLLPTPDALLHPQVTHELEMVRRLNTPWRLIGYAYLSDIGHKSVICDVAASRFDEIRVIDQQRPSTDAFAVRPATLELADVFEEFRHIQASEQVSGPILTRAPLPRACTPRPAHESV